MEIKAWDGEAASRQRICEIALAAFPGISIEERIEKALVLPPGTWKDLRSSSIESFLDQVLRCSWRWRKIRSPAILFC